MADAVDPQQAVANTDPLLAWVLYAQLGTARLVQVNPVTGIATTSATHTFATHWLPMGVANDKLLWQRTDTITAAGDVSAVEQERRDRKSHRVSLYGGQLLGPAAPISTPSAGPTARRVARRRDRAVGACEITGITARAGIRCAIGQRAHDTDR